MEIKLISRDEAIALNQSWYYTGTVCQNGHICERYVNTGICYACKRKQNNRDYKNHKPRVAASLKKSYSKYREQRLHNSQKWAENNREKSNQIKKKYKIINREKCLNSQNAREQRKRENPLYRINSAISKQIWSFMKGKKGGRKWESIVGYSFDELKIHLENRFLARMNWDNYGTIWEIDHITPKSWFKEGSGDDVIKKIWSLSNLQPMLCSENRSKSNRFEGYIMENKEYLHNALKTESSNFEAIGLRLKEVDTVRLLHSFMGLSTEANELVDMLKKHMFYGKPIDKTNIVEELGDIFWFIAISSDVLGISFEEIMEKNIAKLKARYGDKFTAEAALNRDLKTERQILES